MVMRRKALIISLIITFCTIGISGCANIHNDVTRTKAEGALAGVGIGAIVGGTIGYLVGGKDGLAIGAGIGTAVGGLTGFSYGTHVAEEKKKFASKEEWLKYNIRAAEKANQDMVTYNKALVIEINNLDIETASLRREYNVKKVKTRAFKSKKMQIDANIASGNKVLKSAKADLRSQVNQLKIAKFELKRSGQALALLKSKIGAMKRNIALMESNTAKLSSYSQRMSV